MKVTLCRGFTILFTMLAIAMVTADTSLGGGEPVSDHEDDFVPSKIVTTESASAAPIAATTQEKLVRKRRAHNNPQLQYKLGGQVFGRPVEDDATIDFLSSFSYSYSFSYPGEVSLSYPSFEYPSISPTTKKLNPVPPPTVEPSKTVTAKLPTAAPSISPTKKLIPVPPTVEPSKTVTTTESPTVTPIPATPQPTTSSTTAETTGSPTASATPFDNLSNDNTSPPTDPPNSSNLVSNSNADSKGDGDGDGDAQTLSSGAAAYIIPLVGIVGGVFIIGAAVRQYVINLDADSFSEQLFVERVRRLFFASYSY